MVKEEGIIAGIKVAEEIFKTFDSCIEFEAIKTDGDIVNNGDIVFKVHGSSDLY